MTDTRRITPVILSGGAGTRLWPLSRPGQPKQLLSLTGDETMLQLTARRMMDPATFTPAIIVAAEADADAIEIQLGEAGAAPALLILEPEPRNTAAAIALAALEAAEDDLLLVCPSDHDIGDDAAFRAAVDAARPFAEDGWLVTFGIKPDRPETGYGYIERGSPLGRGVFQVERFVEKPDRDTAASYFAGGVHDWNAGIFLFSAGACLRALDEHAPDILEAARAASLAQRRDGIRVRPDAQNFARTPSRPIDRAVMEKAARIAVVPVEMGWSDIGSWDALYALGPHDEDGNLLVGDVLAMGSGGSLIRSDGPTIVALGVRDLIVVATEGAVLIVPRGETQRVKDAVERLRPRPEKG